MLEVRRATDDEFPRCRALRHEVFIVGQGVSEAEEYDGWDPECTHFLACRDGADVGTARLRRHPTLGAKAERVAVRAPHRGQGVGAALMRAVEDEARRQGCTEIVLSAQEQAVPFYERLGYRIEGAPYVEAGIPHRFMRKTPAPRIA